MKQSDLVGKKAHNQAKSFMEDIGEVITIPGAAEMLISMAAEELGGPKGGKTKQLRLYNMGGAVEKAGGGLAQAAEMTRRAGRGDDEMLVHLSPEEYEVITSMWGEPEINPDTGIPEYGFLSKLWKGVKKTFKKIVKSPLFSFLAPIALNVFLPGVGAALTGALGKIGSQVVTRAALGAMSGGKEGAISGALSGLVAGGVGGDIGGKLGLEGKAAEMAGNALLGGTTAELSGGDFMTGALGTVANELTMAPLRSGAESAMRGIKGALSGPQQTLADPTGAGVTGGPASPVPSEAKADPLGTQQMAGAPIQTGEMSPVMDQPQPGLLQRGMDWVADNPYKALAGGTALMGMMGAGSQQEGAAPPDRLTGFDYYEDLPPIAPFDRHLQNVGDYYTYGQVGAPQMGEADFFSGNMIPGIGVQAEDPRDPPGFYVPPGGGGGGRGGRGARRIPSLGPGSTVGPGRTGIFERTGEVGEVGYYPDPVAALTGGRRAADQRRQMAEEGWTLYGGYYYPEGYFAPGTEPTRGPRGTWSTPSQALPVTPTAPPTAGAAQPFVVRGPYDMIKMTQLVNEEGYTYDPETKTAYPPGTYGGAGYSMGGFVDMPQKPYSMQMQYYALGGLVKKYQAGGEVAGPGTGRSDEIPAMLSDGEYVMDAETVAMLGDGSTNAGARKLDEMRKNLRKHKGKKLAKGGFSHNAKDPEEYIKKAKGGKVKSKKGLAEVKRLAKKLEYNIERGNTERTKELRKQLKGLPGGDKVLNEMAKGGKVKRILESLERTAENPDITEPAGPRERRAKQRRAKQRKEGRGRRLSDKEAAELAEELGGFAPNSAFIRRFKRDLAAERSKSK